MSKTTHVWKKHSASHKEAAGTRLSLARRRKVAQLSEAQGHRCAYCCGETFLGSDIPKGMSRRQRATLEHLVPQSEPVQTNRDENLVMACSRCNNLRSNYDAMKYYTSLRTVKKRVLRQKKITAAKSAKNKIKDGRCLALCLIAIVIDPVASAYWGEHWKPRVPRHIYCNKRPHQIHKLGLRMKEDPRRMAA